MLFALIALAAVTPASIQLEKDERNGNVIRVVSGYPGKLTVHVAMGDDLPAVLGSSRQAGDDLIFTPRYPLQPGQSYRVDYSGGVKVSRTLSIDAAHIASGAHVEEVFPTTSTLPANQLKLYIQFSAPMSRGLAYRHIHLFDAEGREVELAFLELNEELWDSDQRRFTLLFDPGRLKRDLVPNLDDGAPLKAGHRYRLKIDRDWPDAQGHPLTSPWQKDFAVVDADRISPDPKQWRIDIPDARTTQTLTVNLPEPMDYGLLMRSFHVYDASDHVVIGSIRIDHHEQRWLFTPVSSWTAGDYRLQIDGKLEDLAGNRIGRLFDVDTRTDAEAAARAAPEHVSLPFTIFPPKLK